MFLSPKKVFKVFSDDVYLREKNFEVIWSVSLLKSREKFSNYFYFDFRAAPSPKVPEHQFLERSKIFLYKRGLRCWRTTKDAPFDTCILTSHSQYHDVDAYPTSQRDNQWRLQQDVFRFSIVLAGGFGYLFALPLHNGKSKILPKPSSFFSASVSYFFSINPQRYTCAAHCIQIARVRSMNFLYKSSLLSKKSNSHKLKKAS